MMNPHWEIAVTCILSLSLPCLLPNGLYGMKGIPNELFNTGPCFDKLYGMPPEPVQHIRNVQMFRVLAELSS